MLQDSTNVYMIINSNLVVVAGFFMKKSNVFYDAHGLENDS